MEKNFAMIELSHEHLESVSGGGGGWPNWGYVQQKYETNRQDNSSRTQGEAIYRFESMLQSL